MLFKAVLCKDADKICKAQSEKAIEGSNLKYIYMQQQFEMCLRILSWRKGNKRNRSLKQQFVKNQKLALENKVFLFYIFFSVISVAQTYNIRDLPGKLLELIKSERCRFMAVFKKGGGQYQSRNVIMLWKLWPWMAESSKHYGMVFCFFSHCPPVPDLCTAASYCVEVAELWNNVHISKAF